jgi:prepilin-type N-terminal cleavage/methylation domain-containing protein
MMMKTILARMNLSADDGFSLAEIMIVTMLMGVILSAAYLAMGTVSTVSDGIMARGQAQDQGQGAIERMVRELRMAQVITDPATNDEIRMANATPTNVSFYADIDHNGQIDRVTYNVAGGLLTRTVAYSGKAAVGPDDFGADSAPVTLAKLDPTDTTVFSYTDGASPPGLNPPADAVTTVQISISTVAKSGASSVTVDFPTTQVQVRAFPSGQ